MLVKVKAKAVGTRVMPEGTQIHTNPKGTDPLAREPIVDHRWIPILLEEPPLIEDPGDLSKLERQPGPNARPVFDLTRVDELAALHVSAIAGIDDGREAPPSGLGHREAVHYDPGQGVGAGADGIMALDPDAPPVDDNLRGASAVEANRTAAGTSVRVEPGVGGQPEDRSSPAHQDGSIRVPRTRRPGRPAKPKAEPEPKPEAKPKPEAGA